MHFQNGLQGELSAIQNNQQDDNSSIINELNLLQDQHTFESRVIKIESFIYAQEPRGTPTPTPHLRDSFLRDPQGNLISPISSSSRKPSATNGYLSASKSGRQGEGKGKKSIRQQIIEQNQILQRRLSLNKNYAPSFPYPREELAPKEGPQQAQSKQGELGREGRVEDEILVKLEEQYSKSRVIKLYNFILQQLPPCQTCSSSCTHISRTTSNVLLSCRNCHPDHPHHPLIAILYDLENKSRFEEETATYQKMLDKIDQQIATLRDSIASLESVKQKFLILKNLNRRKYKQINQSKFFLKKHLNNLTQAHLKELERLIPREYLEQMQVWSEISQKMKGLMEGSTASAALRVMPVHLQEGPLSKLVGNLRRLLNYEKEQSVKISISEHIRFPLKQIDTAVFVVDGAYSLPVFDHIRHLRLEFHHKKTLRELSLLFASLPRHIHSLALAYNHKIHSHISAEAFPFLQVVAAPPSIRKLQIKVENAKDFCDVLEMAGVMSPKAEVRVKVTKHMFSKNSLILPHNYYHSLVGRLGSELTKLELDLPQSADSPAVIDYQQLASLPYLTVFRVRRGEKDSKQIRKMQILEDSAGEQMEKKKKLILLEALGKRANLVRVVREWKGGREALKSILFFLL